MPRMVMTHAVKDVKLWAAKSETLGDLFAPFATDVVAYVAADGSDQVAVAADIHDLDGLMAFMQTPQAAESMEADGVLQPITWHMEGTLKSVPLDKEVGLEGIPTRTEFGLVGN